MIYEQEFLFQMNPSEIRKSLINNKTILIEDGISIFSIENNNIVKYKDIYIGGVSPNFNLRQGFGLNKYENSSSFYLGQWENNMKEGNGFLKIDENTLYIGSFHLNQFEGFGILYYKSHDTFYLGEFQNGTFSKGIYCNISKELYYRGKFVQSKKSDSFCTFLEKNNRHLFLGEVKDDVFIKGYLCLYQINETERHNENGEDDILANFDTDEIFYFDKTDEKNISFIHYYEFENEFKNKIQENMKKIFEVDYRFGYKVKDIIDYFKYLESLVDDDDHNHLEGYNKDDDKSLEKFFLSNYNYYYNIFEETQEEMDINEVRKEIEIPEINKENLNYTK